MRVDNIADLFVKYQVSGSCKSHGPHTPVVDDDGHDHHAVVFVEVPDP